MRILFVSESTWMEGVVYDLHVMAEGLSLLGHEVYAIDPGLPLEPTEPQSKSVLKRSVSRVFPAAVVHLRTPRLPSLSSRFRIKRIRSLCYFYGAKQYLHEHFRRYVEINRFLAEETFDVIVLYSGVRSGFQTVLLARRHRIPVVFRNVDILHNLWPTPVECTLAKMMEKRVYPRVDMLLALTPKYAEYLIRMGGDRSKVELLVFPIDIELFNSNSECLDLRARWGIRPSDKAIVFVGTLYEFSGLGDFIRKFPAVLKEVPEAKLVIVGDGPLRPSLDKIVDELNLRNHVAITGYQPFADMPRYIGMATMCLNVFPITERTKDIFSAKIIQYLACGKATVSSSLPGITTLISSGVVYAENTDRMVEEVVSLLKSPEKRDLLGQAGRKYIEDSHSHTKVILRLENALQRIVRNAGTERTGTAK